MDMDALVHQLLAEDEKIIREVAEAFPNAVENNAINRRALGAIVFADNAELAKLEAILHPAARAKMGDWLDEQKAAGYERAG